jgi:tetratricopeptide (TPR) repeat protein
MSRSPFFDGSRCCALRIAVVFFLCIALAVSAAAQQAAPSLAEQARAAAAAGDFARAAVLWRQVLDREPENPVALDGMIVALERTGHLSEAAPYLEKLIVIWPTHAYRIFQLGQVLTWRGDTVRGNELMRRALALEPDNPDFSANYADMIRFDRARQPEAEQLLRRSLAAYPEHAQTRRVLARLLASQGKRDEALELLRPLMLRPETSAYDYVVLGQIEQATGQSEEAERAYRTALSLDPNHLEAIARLAEMLSWQTGRKAEAVELFERGLKIEPQNEMLLVPYARILFWQKETSPRAMEMLESVVKRNPQNLQAKAALAQMNSYRGQPERAMTMYEEVLARDPDNVPALRGKAEILNWRGRHREALELLNHAARLWPDDTSTRVEMARAHMGLRLYGDARGDIALAVGYSGPFFEDLRREVNRSLGTYMELGYMHRAPIAGLHWNRMDATFSTPLGRSHRVSFRFQPTFYEARESDFQSNEFAVMLDSDWSENLSTRAEFSGTQYFDAPANFDGAFSLRYRARPSLILESGFRRQSVEDSFTAGRGQIIASEFRGQVRSNLGFVRASYYGPHGWDVSGGYTDGYYTGRNLDTNRRWGMDAGFGKVLHGFQPYVRVGYGFLWFNFDFDAGARPGAGPPRVAAEYFSPHRFVLNYGAVAVNYRWIPRVDWENGATLGVQHVKANPFAPYDQRMASSVFTSLVWHVNEKNDLRFSYSFQDTFNAFRAHVIRVSWRHYF